MVKPRFARLQQERMTDLINKIDDIINVSVNHINEKHKELSPDWKAWSVLIIRNRYLEGKLKKIDDIPKIIDDFLTFWETDYKKYCENIIAATEYDKDRGFVFRYERKIGTY